MSNLDLAVIGNSSVAALIDKHARIIFASMPRLDSDPVFCALLRGGEAVGADPADGAMSVELRDFASAAAGKSRRELHDCGRRAAGHGE